MSRRRISPDWRYWTQIPEMELWKFAALSCDIEPRLLDRRKPAGYGGPSRLSDFESLHKVLPDPQARREANRIRERQEIACANLGKSLEPSELVNGKSPEYSQLTGAEFLRWAEAMHWDVPKDFWRLRSELAVKPRTSKWPWGSYETKKLRIMHEVIEKCWVNFDPDEPDTAPTNEQVEECLIERGLSKRAAEVIAQIIRADGLPPGPRTPGKKK